MTALGEILTDIVDLANAVSKRRDVKRQGSIVLIEFEDADAAERAYLMFLKSKPFPEPPPTGEP